jgi:hypothetical protein
MKRLVAAGCVALGSAGLGSFAGVAAADPETCWGGIGSGSDHQPNAVSGAAQAGCVLEHDASDMSMTDIDEVGTWGMADIAGAGSYPDHAPAFRATPQTMVP